MLLAECRDPEGPGRCEEQRPGPSPFSATATAYRPRNESGARAARAPERVEGVEIRRRIPTTSHTYYCCSIPSRSGERFWGRQALFNRFARVSIPIDMRTLNFSANEK